MDPKLCASGIIIIWSQAYCSTQYETAQVWSQARTCNISLQLTLLTDTLYKKDLPNIYDKKT